MEETIAAYSRILESSEQEEVDWENAAAYKQQQQQQQQSFILMMPNFTLMFTAFLSATFLPIN